MSAKSNWSRRYFSKLDFTLILPVKVSASTWIPYICSENSSIPLRSSISCKGKKPDIIVWPLPLHVASVFHIMDITSTGFSNVSIFFLRACTCSSHQYVVPTKLGFPTNKIQYLSTSFTNSPGSNIKFFRTFLLLDISDTHTRYTNLLYNYHQCHWQFLHNLDRSEQVLLVHVTFPQKH